jgi:hypothetical protein
MTNRNQPIAYNTLFLLLGVIILHAAAWAQPLRKNIDCGTMGDGPAFMPDYKKWLQQRPQLQNTLPHVVRIYIRIVRDNNGSNAACSEETALQNFEEMKGQFNGHNICFLLVGLDYINDTYLNNFNIADSLGSTYPNYIRQRNYDIDGAITIFIHYNFLFNVSSSGNAYDIPNNFCSIARWAVESPDVRSIFGHEVGHCLGLYHTFQRRRLFENGPIIREGVTRSPNQPCYNCETEGDFCCDTPADVEENNGIKLSNEVNEDCIYTGQAQSDCNNERYAPSTRNIMSYMPWSCISTTSTALTADQRDRMHAALLNPLSIVAPTKMPAGGLTISGANTATSGLRMVNAIGNITMAAGATISNTGSARVYYASQGAIVFSAGTTHAPTGSGVVLAMSGSSCN